LFLSAIEKAAADEKETCKNFVTEELVADELGPIYEVKNGKITMQTRTDFELMIVPTIAAIQSGRLTVEVLLKHIKPTASLKAALGESLTSELMTSKANQYWMLKPTESIKVRAKQFLADAME